MTKGAKKLTDFLEGEKERLDSIKEQAWKEKGYLEFFTPPKGVSKITVLPKIPRIMEGKYGTRRVFRVKVNGTEFDYGINPSSPVYRILIEKMQATGGKPIEITLMRSGEGKATRYEVL